MKKFKFKLDALLKVTKMKKDQAEISFAEAVQQLKERKLFMAKLQEEMSQGLSDYNRLTEGAKITVGTLMTYNSFFAWKREQIELQDQAILDSKAMRSKRLKELMELRNRLKAIEQLRQKRLEEFKQQQLFEEQKELDEIGLQIYTRTARLGG
jgi:flagellar FliJ protein